MRGFPWPESIILFSHLDIQALQHIPILARTMLRQPKHAMNSVGDEIHRFALPERATQTAIKTRIGFGKLNMIVWLTELWKNDVSRDCTHVLLFVPASVSCATEAL